MAENKKKPTEEWFEKNVHENEKELLEIGELANRMLHEKISLGLTNPITTIAAYGTIFDVITKYEEEYKKEKKNFEEYSRYTEQMEESAGNLSTCLDKIEGSLRNIESIILSASANRKISKKLYKVVMGDMECIEEYINDVDEDI